MSDIVHADQAPYERPRAPFLQRKLKYSYAQLDPAIEVLPVFKQMSFRGEHYQVLERQVYQIGVLHSILLTV